MSNLPAMSVVVAPGAKVKHFRKQKTPRCGFEMAYGKAYRAGAWASSSLCACARKSGRGSCISHALLGRSLFAEGGGMLIRDQAGDASGRRRHRRHARTRRETRRPRHSSCCLMTDGTAQSGTEGGRTSRVQTSSGRMVKRPCTPSLIHSGLLGDPLRDGAWLMQRLTDNIHETRPCELTFFPCLGQFTRSVTPSS